MIAIFGCMLCVMMVLFFVTGASEWYSQAVIIFVSAMFSAALVPVLLRRYDRHRSRGD